MSKHLKKALEALPEELREFIEVTDENAVAFAVQDGPIGENGVNGIQAVDIVKFGGAVIASLNEDFPCKENEETLRHIDAAVFYQDERTKDREERGVEGKDEA